ncbi:MAG: metallophosphoesterase [Candidatus Micrarchaeia archaeon]
MKLLALADIHADEATVDRLRVRLSKNPYDAVLVAGDLTNHGPLSFAQDLLSFLDRTYAIHGNMDPPEVARLLEEKGVGIHGKRVPLGGGYAVAGFGGSNPTPFNTPTEYSEEEITSGLSRLRIDPKTILLTHAPPYGLLDTVGEGIHVGSKSIRAVIEAKQPLLNICGHIHECEGEGEIGKTKVIKLGAAEKGKAAEITIDKEIKTKFIFL